MIVNRIDGENTRLFVKLIFFFYEKNYGKYFKYLSMYLQYQGLLMTLFPVLKGKTYTTPIIFLN